MKRITAIVVTYNRRDLLLQCIERLSASRIDAPGCSLDILVIDNASTDGTAEALAPLEAAGMLRVHNPGRNLGGAGGFNLGMRLAVEDGCDFLWVMDDDCLVHDDSLQALLDADRDLAAQGIEYGWLSSVVRWTDGSICSMNVQRHPLTRNITDFSPALQPCTLASFVSLFVPARTVMEIGLPVKDFFIWTDDWDFTRRASRLHPCYVVGRSVVTHASKTNGAGNIYTDPPERIDRYRYVYRNDVVLYREEGLFGWAFLAARAAVHAAHVVVGHGDAAEKLKKLGIIARGNLDGVRFHPAIERIDPASVMTQRTSRPYGGAAAREASEQGGGRRENGAAMGEKERIDFKLANVLLAADDFLAGHEAMVYRADAGSVRTLSDGALEFSGAVDFTTYFNCLSLAKWRRYAGIDNACLHIELSGDACEIDLVGLYAIGSAPTEADRGAGQGDWEATLRMAAIPACTLEASADYRIVDLPIEMDDAVQVGFFVATTGTVRIRRAWYSAQVAPTAIRPVKLAVCTTTFNNEQYILPNIQLIRDGVLGSTDAVAGNFRLFVVDNGRSLDAQALSDGGVTVIPNPNTGGSGGFARGMMAALDANRDGAGFTHVLLMDDDVRVSPESFKRTFNLLSLAQGPYRDAFINGAMLKLQEPNMQFEDVSIHRKSGGYIRIKPNYDMETLRDVVANETVSVEAPNAYGAWWYCCIPIKAIQEHGLPLPLFVRGDDVEYGMRCKPLYMAMGGICVWHQHFVGRFRASVDAYQKVRNLLIGMACNDAPEATKQAFLARSWYAFHVYLRMMDYGAAELLLDGLEDYLRGPDWLAKADGAAILKANGAKNEKLVSIEELDPAIMDRVQIHPEYLGRSDERRSVLSRCVEALPHDRHLLPDFLLRNEPAAIDYSASFTPWQETACQRTLVAVSPDATRGHIRTMDRARYRELMGRYRRVMADYARCHREVEKAYRDAFPYLTSEAFWRKYLGMPEEALKGALTPEGEPGDE